MAKSSKYALRGAAYSYSSKYNDWRNRVIQGREAHEEARAHSVSVGLMMVNDDGTHKYTHGFPYPAIS